MIKSLLVCTDGSPHGDYSIRYGIYLARQFQARISILHVLDSRMLEGPMLANISGWLGAEAFTDPLNQFRGIMQQKGEAVLAAAVAMCEQEGITDVGSILKWGHPARVILREEIQTELVILGQDGEHDEMTGEWTGSTVDRVVRHSSKPILVVPDTFVPIEKIMAAYDGSAHASKALLEAIEWALALSKPLVICSVAESGDQQRAMDHADTAMRLARSHECAAAHLIAEGKPAEVLVQKAIELDCRLLVAGAHGHSRIREWILGGTAQQLINTTRIPLLMVP